MSKFNPNRPADFAAMVNGAGIQLLQAFSRNREEWDIVEGSFTGGGQTGKQVFFHIFQQTSDYEAGLTSVQDSGGRRKVRLTMPYEDGQTTDDMGRRGEDFDIDVVFFGPRYKSGMLAFLAQVQRPQPGTLIHPVRGSVRCGMETYSLIHSHDAKQAVVMRVRFTEHNFDVAKLDIKSIAKSVKGRLSGAIAALQKVGQAIETVRAAVLLVVSIRRDIERKIEEFKNYVQGFLVDANATFNPGSSADLPGIVPVHQGGLAAPVTDATTSSSTARTANVGGTSITATGYIRVGTRFTTVVSPGDPFANLPLALLSDTARQAVAVLQLTNRVETIRQQAAAIVDEAENAQNGQGASLLYDATEAITAMAVACQEVLQAGIASSRARLNTYTLPRLMSVREVAFANGLTPNEGEEIEIMNPALESANYIPKGTVLKIPVNR